MTELGRRDRKKLQTRMAIEQAAVTLVAEAGLSAITVEAIAHRADVTPRTFFNYFADKEDALLGLPRGALDPASPPSPPAQGWGEPGAAPLQLGLAMLAAQLRSLVDDAQPALMIERRLILLRHPELLARQVERMTVAEDQLTALLRTAYADRGVAAADVESRARMATFVLTAAARIAVEEWCREEIDAGELPERLGTALEQMRSVLAE